MKFPNTLAALLLWAATGVATAQVPPAQVFVDMDAVCARDEQALWGVSLCGPLIIADRTTRAVQANRADAENKLAPAGPGLWTGTLPDGVNIANTAIDWAGVRWAMVMSPVPDGMTSRRVLLGHEAFHRIQDGLGIALSGAANAHLETEAGRTWLRLEMRALRAALQAKEDSPRLLATRDALAFRAARLGAFPGADAEERALDRGEGLAEYTGVRLGVADAETYAAEKLRSADAQAALARSYAYATGPAWGLLLDQQEGYWRTARWRKSLGARAPAEVLATKVRVDRAPVETRLARYDGAAVAAEEAARAATAAARVAGYRAAFVDGPRLIAPLSTFQMEMDPNGVTPVAGLGQVYATLTLRDAWGEFVARGDAVIAEDFKSLTAATPTVEEGRVVGPDWTLTLKPGWRATAQDGGVVRLEPSP